MKIADAKKQAIADLIHKELGIVYDSNNEFQLDSRLNEIVKTLQLESTDQLHQKFAMGGDWKIKQLILNIAINNETSFYRDPKVFIGFKECVLPAVRQLVGSSSPLRVWSAASSFGQEPYTLSMILSEMAEKEAAFPSYEIHATDVSQAALNRAEKGVYTQLEVQRGLSASQMIKNFTKTPDNQWEIQDRLKKPIQFKKYNLLDPIPFDKPFHVIFCRNVLIYQDSESKKNIIAKMTQKLLPGGFLILGATESLIGLSSDYQQIAHSGAVFYAKKAG